MHQPAVIPNVVGMSLTNSEVEHLLGLLDVDDVGNEANGAVRLLDLVTDLEVTGANPLVTELLMPFRLGPGLGV